MTNYQACELIQHLKKIKGSVCYDGDASVQVVVPLIDGTWLRVGITDDDVAERPGLWFDFYEGLNGELKNNLPGYVSKE